MCACCRGRLLPGALYSICLDKDGTGNAYIFEAYGRLVGSIRALFGLRVGLETFLLDFIIRLRGFGHIMSHFCSGSLMWSRKKYGDSGVYEGQWQKLLVHLATLAFQSSIIRMDANPIVYFLSILGSESQVCSSNLWRSRDLLKPRSHPTPKQLLMQVDSLQVKCRSRVLCPTAGSSPWTLRLWTWATTTRRRGQSQGSKVNAMVLSRWQKTPRKP